MPNTRVLRASNVEGGIFTEFTPQDLGWSGKNVASIAAHDSGYIDLSGYRFLKVFLRVTAVDTPAPPNAATALQIIGGSYDGTIESFPVAQSLCNALVATPAVGVVYGVALAPGSAGLGIGTTVVAGVHALLGWGRVKFRLNVVTSTLGTSVTSDLWVHAHS